MPRKKKHKRRSYSQDVLLVLTGSALTLCFLSIMYGVLIRESNAGRRVQGLRIEILNGTGQAGLASRAAEALRTQRGLDVLHVGNADSYSYRETILVARKKGVDLEPLARALGCESTIEQLRDDSIVDATLIIGSDYKELKLGMEPDSGLLE